MDAEVLKIFNLAAGVNSLCQIILDGVPMRHSDLITQAEILSLSKWWEIKRLIEDYRKTIRSRIIQKATVQPGLFNLQVTDESRRQITVSNIKRILGEKESLKFLDQFPKISIRRLLVKREYMTKKEEARILESIQKDINPEGFCGYISPDLLRRIEDAFINLI